MRSYIPNFSFYLCPGLASAITIHTEIICGEIGSVTCHYTLTEKFTQRTKFLASRIPNRLSDVSLYAVGPCGS
jgi:hypothetical protein